MSTRGRTERPSPPLPDRLWSPPQQFARLDRRLLLAGLLDRVPHETLVVYVFLCLAADERGVSWYRRDTISKRTGLSWSAISAAIDRLLALGWIGFRPWQCGGVDGVYQVLDLPRDE